MQDHTQNDDFMKNETGFQENGNDLIALLVSLDKWDSNFKEEPSNYLIESFTIDYDLFIDIYEARIQSNKLLNVKVNGLIELVDKVLENRPEFILSFGVKNERELRYVYTDLNTKVLYGII